MIDWVSALLSSWGSWVARQQDGGIGWRRSDSTCREYKAPITGQEDRLPSDLRGIDMDRISRAVQDLPDGRQPLRQLVLRRYVQRHTYRRLAGDFLRPEQTLRNWMGDAHVQLAREVTRVSEW